MEPPPPFLFPDVSAYTFGAPPRNPAITLIHLYVYGTSPTPLRRVSFCYLRTDRCIPLSPCGNGGWNRVNSATCHSSWKNSIWEGAGNTEGGFREEGYGEDLIKFRYRIGRVRVKNEKRGEGFTKFSDVATWQTSYSNRSRFFSLLLSTYARIFYECLVFILDGPSSSSVSISRKACIRGANDIRERKKRENVEIQNWTRDWKFSTLGRAKRVRANWCYGPPIARSESNIDDSDTFLINPSDFYYRYIQVRANLFG